MGENGRFTIAAAFGNVHGVYAPGNVELTPQILHNCQAYIKEKEGLDTDKPCSFVFHGGSGSSREDIRYAIEAGTIKMNIDTDTQWAFWDGLRAYEAEFRPYLQGQIGNPDGEEKPNKRYYDPAWRFAGARSTWRSGCARRPRTSTASTSFKHSVSALSALDSLRPPIVGSARRPTAVRRSRGCCSCHMPRARAGSS